MVGTVPFLIGFVLAFLPAYAPFAGIVFGLARPWNLDRNDVVWLLAALLYAMPAGANAGVLAAGANFLQILAAWLVFRAFRRLKVPASSSLDQLGIGLLIGLTAVTVLGWLQIERLSFAYQNIAQAIIWEGDAALYGHSVLILGMAAALLNRRMGFKFAALGISAVGIVASGSREAGIGWLIFALASPLISEVVSTTKRRIIAFSAAIIMSGLAAILGAFAGWGTSGFLVQLAPQAGESGNLIQSSEVPDSGWWFTQGVAFDTADTEIAGMRLTSYTVSKDGPVAWYRLQQIVSLFPEQTYTASAWVLAPSGIERPAIQGWGQLDGGGTFTVTATLQAGEVVTTSSGPGSILTSGIAERDDGWSRIFVTFEYQGSTAPLYWYVGLAPDNRDSLQGATTFAAFDVRQSAEVVAYEPGVSSRGLGIEVARLPYWRAALDAFTTSPWLGTAEDFNVRFERDWPERQRFHATPAHAHNFFLEVLYQYGVIGFVGVALALTALAAPAIVRRDRAFMLLFLVIMLINVFDYTMFYAGVLYPLVALAGWRVNRAEEQRYRRPLRLS